MPTTSAFLGLRGTGDWATDQRPLNWRQMILRLYPNGSAPLTAFLSKLGNEKVNDPQYHWWTKALPLQAGAVTGVYLDSGLSNAYVSGGTAGQTLYIKMAEALIKEIRAGHQVLLRDSSDLTVDVVAKVTDRSANGTSSYAEVKLLEADDNSTSNDLSDCDRILVTGSINSEGSAMPDAVSYDPIKWYNLTQIFKTPLEITRTAEMTNLRTNPQAYQELKREALELHSIEMEKAFLFGIPTEGTGDNGKPERTTCGLINAIKGSGIVGHGGTGGTVSDYPTDSSYSGQSWLQGGEDWLDTQIAEAMRYGSTEKTAFCGDGALLALNKLVKNGGDFSFTAATAEYGINVIKWVTPLGMINLIRHPLMSYETTTRNSMIIFEPKNVKYRFITDTTFQEDKSSGWTKLDGRKEQYLTECGLEYHHPIGWAYLTGVGSDNSV